MGDIPQPSKRKVTHGLEEKVKINSTEFEVMPESLFDVHLILMRVHAQQDQHNTNTDPSAIGELRITPSYHIPRIWECPDPGKDARCRG